MSNTLTTLAPLNVYSADTFYLRLRGLLGRRELQTNEALHIQPCSDVHTFGMKYNLDIVFLDNAGSVLKIDSLEPNRWAYCKGAKSVLEFKAGCAQLHGYDEQVEVNEAFNNENIVCKSIGDRA